MIEDEVPQPREAVYGDNSGDFHRAALDEHTAFLHDVVQESGKTYERRRSEFLTSASRQVVRDRESAGAAADTIKLAGEVWAEIEAHRKERSEPFRTTHLALTAAAREFWEPVVEQMQGLAEQIDAYTEVEDKRIADQRAEQQRERAALRNPTIDPEKEKLAEQALDTALGHKSRPIIDYNPSEPRVVKVMAAPSPQMLPAKRAKIRGDLGATVSQKTIVEYEIEDISLIPAHIMTSPTVVEAILTVVRSTARHMGIPAGIRVKNTTGNRIS
jgi:hypothetical protein